MLIFKKLRFKKKIRKEKLKKLVQQNLFNLKADLNIEKEINFGDWLKNDFFINYKNLDNLQKIEEALDFLLKGLYDLILIGEKNKILNYLFSNLNDIIKYFLNTNYDSNFQFILLEIILLINETFNLEEIEVLNQNFVDCLINYPSYYSENKINKNNLIIICKILNRCLTHDITLELIESSFFGLFEYYKEDENILIELIFLLNQINVTNNESNGVEEEICCFDDYEHDSLMIIYYYLINHFIYKFFPLEFEEKLLISIKQFIKKSDSQLSSFEFNDLINILIQKINSGNQNILLYIRFLKFLINKLESKNIILNNNLLNLVPCLKFTILEYDCSVSARLYYYLLFGFQKDNNFKDLLKNNWSIFEFLLEKNLIENKKYIDIYLSIIYFYLNYLNLNDLQDFLMDKIIKFLVRTANKDILNKRINKDIYKIIFNIIYETNYNLLKSNNDLIDNINQIDDLKLKKFLL